MRGKVGGLGSLLLIGSIACGPGQGLADDETGDAGSTGEDPQIGTDSGDESDTSSSEDPGETETQGTEDTDDTEETGDTDGMDGCGDGIPMSGEVCYVQHVLDGTGPTLGQILARDFDDDGQLDLLATGVSPCPDVIGPELDAPDGLPEPDAGDAQAIDGGVGGLTWLLGPDASFGEPIAFVDSLVAGAGAGVFVPGGNVDVLFVDDLYSLRIPGDGAGGFGPAIPVELPYLSYAEFADLDADGLLDVVGIDVTQLVAARSDGLGGFEAHATELELAISSPRIVDLDGDPFPDVLVRRDDELVPLFGGGDGSFELGTSTTIVDLRSFEPGDFDDDGIVDVAVGFGDYPEYRLGVWLGTADAQFVDPGVSAPSNTTSLLLGRFDGDAILDLATQRSETLTIYPGDGQGGIGASLSQPIEYLLDVVEDLDGDGIDDLVGGSEGHSWPLVVYLSNP